MIFKGLKFGMLLQMAVGPVCLLVFQTAASFGAAAGLLPAMAAALADAAYIALACAGAAALLKNERIAGILRTAGAAVLVWFGAGTLLGAFGVFILPGPVSLPTPSGGNLFLKGLAITASNPMTILFWGSVFSARTARDGWNRRQLSGFAAGCVLSTALFLSAVSMVGGLVGGVLPVVAARSLNALVGGLLIAFGLCLPFRKPEGMEDESAA